MKPVPPEAVDTLLNHLLQPDEIHTKPFMALVGENRDAFLKKHFQYQMAMTALCLVVHEGKDDRFSAIRGRFDETVVFPGFQRNTWSQSSFFAAMRELADLENATTRSAKPLTWAKEWFFDIGAEITNPVDLTLFVVGWQQSIYYMAKMFDDIGNAY